jgi:hypothetical protein
MIGVRLVAGSDGDQRFFSEWSKPRNSKRGVWWPSSVRPTFGPGPASPIIQRDSTPSARSVPYHTHRTGPRKFDYMLLGNMTYRGPGGSCSCGYTWSAA